MVTSEKLVTYSLELYTKNSEYQRQPPQYYQLEMSGQSRRTVSMTLRCQCLGALFTVPYIQDPLYVLLPMVLFGIGWAAMMGIPYSMVSKVVPQERRGVYMGILNMMIVIPMGIETLTFGPIFKNLLGGNSVNAMLFAAVFFVIASVLAMRLNVSKAKNEYPLDA